MGWKGFSVKRLTEGHRRAASGRGLGDIVEAVWLCEWIVQAPTKSIYDLDEVQILAGYSLHGFNDTLLLNEGGG